MENKHTRDDLYQMQSLPLSAKIRMTERRIRDWIDTYGRDEVAVSFSGGKDSTVLMDIVRNKMNYKDIEGVFVNVPTQYPELRQFSERWDNVRILNPKISFMEVCEKYGFPLISKEVAHKYADLYSAHDRGRECYVDRQLNGTYVSKNGKKNQIDIQKYKYIQDAPFRISHQCCNIMKKNPLYSYAKKTGKMYITAQMAEESYLRLQHWLKNGCNMYNIKHPISNPMSFWTEQDVLQYIKENNLPICSVYGEVVEDWDKTEDVAGQMTISDMVGFENEKRFDAEKPPLKTTGCSRTGCMLCGFGCHLEKPGEGRFELLKKTHPKMYDMLDVAKNNGVSMREAIEWINENGGTDIRL